MQHRVMLDGGSDNMLSLLRVRLRGRFDGPVIAFRPSRGKINLIVRGSQAFSNGLPDLADRLLAFRPEGIDAAGISVMLRKIRKHGLHYLRRSPGGRRIVQIDL